MLAEDRLNFRFRGQLASGAQMNFYEAARFQYASARLLLKLSQFREKGNFSSRITSDNQRDIRLEATQAGSFIFDIMPLATLVAPVLLEVPLSAMLSYVIERVFKPADDEVMKQALSNDAKAIDILGKAMDRGSDATRDILDHLREERALVEKLSEDKAALYERLLAESSRRSFLEGRASAFANVSPQQEAKLITMAAPLIKEMGVPLRKSASRLDIVKSTGHVSQPIASIDESMTDEIELAVVDDEITPLLINIVQYNKETGWGKFRSADFNGLASFSVPSDRKPVLQGALLDSMDNKETYVQSYYVRSKAGVPLRIIIVKILDIEQFEKLF